MEVKINNCGNVSEGKFSLVERELNIKYGINGLGKTSISRGIYYSLSSPEMLESLKTFGSDVLPKIELPSELKTCMYFDRDYVKNYLFKEEVLNNSYEIVVKTPNFEDQKSNIESKIKDLIEVAKDQNLATFVKLVDDFEKSVSFSNQDEIKGSSALGKGLKSGYIDLLIQGDFERYRKYLVSPKRHDWSTWFSSGLSLKIDDTCPFCLAPLSSDFDECSASIQSTFNSSALKENTFSRNMLTRVSSVSEQDVKDTIDEIMEADKKPTLDQSKKIKIMLDKLCEERQKINNLASLSPMNLISNLNTENLTSNLNKNFLDVEYFKNIDEVHLNAAKKVNFKLKEIIDLIDDLVKELGKLNGLLSNRIKGAKKFINDFFDIAGIPYLIDVRHISDDKYESFLVHHNINSKIDKPEDKLSYGELNAISLILFIVEANYRNHDLIILDDPVSSFDNNKKYAIFHHLFGSSTKDNLRGKTVLILTHDLSPIIDFLLIGKPSSDKVNASFLTLKNRVVTELPISKEDIMLSQAFEIKLAKNKDSNIISQLVHLRKYLELTDEKSDGQYDVVSSLLHLRNNPTRITISGEIELEKDVIENASNKICQIVSDFDYENILAKLKDIEYLRDVYSKASSIEKLTIIRIYEKSNYITIDNRVLFDFINESYHIENDFIFTLDPTIYNQIPEYITLMCDKIISRVE